MFVTIRFLAADLRALFRTQPNPYAGVLGISAGKARTLVRVLMQVAISLLVVGLDAWVIHDPNQSQDSKKLAFGTLGTVIGYWLR